MKYHTAVKKDEADLRGWTQKSVHDRCHPGVQVWSDSVCWLCWQQLPKVCREAHTRRKWRRQAWTGTLSFHADPTVWLPSKSSGAKMGRPCASTWLGSLRTPCPCLGTGDHPHSSWGAGGGPSRGRIHRAHLSLPSWCSHVPWRGWGVPT